MVKQEITRIGINMTADDKKTLGKLKTRLKSEHGLLNTTDIVRIALRALLTVKASQ